MNKKLSDVPQHVYPAENTKAGRAEGSHCPNIFTGSMEYYLNREFIKKRTVG